MLLGLVPLALATGVFGGGREEPVQVGFLPFEARGDDGGLEAASSAIFEGVHERFRREDDPRYVLIGPAVTARFRGSEMRPEETGRRIGADVVVAGHLQPTAVGDIEIAAALVRSADGRALWTGELEVADAADRDTRRRVVDWIADRVRRTLQTIPSSQR